MKIKTTDENHPSIYRVRLISVSPKSEPCQPDGGWYTLPAQHETVASVLKLFGLDEGGLTVLLNGRHVDHKQMVRPGDDLHILLRLFGG